MGLTHDAKAAYTEYYNHHNNEQTDLSGELSAAWSKLEEYAARLALVIHFTRWAAGTANSDDVIDVESMQAGIKLAQWFKSEARRIYPRLSESDDDRDQRRRIEWIERKGGSVTAREVQQGHRRYRTAEDADAALGELVAAGNGDWHDVASGQKGGQPSRVFRLSTSTQPPKTRDSEGSVDVDSVDATETQSDNDWGEL